MEHWEEVLVQLSGSVEPGCYCVSKLSIRQLGRYSTCATDSFLDQQVRTLRPESIRYEILQSIC